MASKSIQTSLIKKFNEVEAEHQLIFALTDFVLYIYLTEINQVTIKIWKTSSNTVADLKISRDQNFYMIDPKQIVTMDSIKNHFRKTFGEEDTDKIFSYFSVII